MTWTHTTTNSNSGTTYPYMMHTISSNNTMTGNYYEDWDLMSQTTGTTSSITSWLTYIVPYQITNREMQEINRDAEELERELNRGLSPEFIREQERRRQEIQKADAEAKEKARILLLEYLDDENKRRISDNKPLEIASKLFNDIKYHIPISHDRIEAWKDNKVIEELCLSVKACDLPLDDIILTKLLHVIHDEENVLRTAQHWQVKENLLARLGPMLN